MSKQINPLVSVIITNYNYANFIADAIKSVLAQTYPNIEIIIIDDGSTDNSHKVIDSYLGDQRIRSLKQKNLGIVFARNRGIDESNGDYILYLDGDDKLPINYVEVLVEESLKRSLDVTYCNYRRFDNETYLKEFPEFDISLIKSENIVHISSLIKKTCLKGQRFDEKLNRNTHEDWDFFLGLALSGAVFGKAKGTELHYRAHGQSRSYDVKTVDDLNKQGIGLYNTYMYIINKYKSLYPGEIEFTEKSEIIGWWRTANERLMMIKDYQAILLEKDRRFAKQKQRLEELDKKYVDILNSRKYKLAEAITSPLRVRNLISKRKKRN